MKLVFGDTLLFLDGAMGTLVGDTSMLPETFSITDPDRIRNIHKSYIDAGANIITTNTFGANRFKLSGTGHSVSKIISSSVSLAKEVAGENAAVTLDVGPLGALLKPIGTLSFDDAYDAFAEMIRAGQGVDMISIETMTDTYELKAAVLAAKENSSVPVLATVSIDENGRLLTGANLASVVSLLEGLGVDALGLNCGLGPVQFKKYFDELCDISSTPIAVLPNAGLPKIIDSKTSYDLSPEDFAVHMQYFAENGAHILGGCCGTTPEHIHLMTDKCKNIVPAPVIEKNRTVVSAYGDAVVFGDTPVIIGERINPTGKKRFKEALHNQEISYILSEGIDQESAGAHILDVNVGLPEINEKEMMLKVLGELQSVLRLPLQIDTGDISTMEQAARYYNGKPLLNSVNGKQDSMEKIFPIAKKYGGVVVALTLDENGIPASADGRIEIAKKIIDTAEKFGISKKNIIIDPLTLAVSAGEGGANETLRALRYIREELKVHTVLGVSNISFGLPDRETLNATFFALALENGLSAGIVNPKSQRMMGVYNSYCVLRGLDADCKNYIEKHTAINKEEPQNKSELSLFDIILKGNKSLAYAAADELLKTYSPMALVEEIMIPALDKVGKGFECGKVFLPQLLASAETVKNAFDAVKNKVSSDDTVKRGKIVLATVYGDIHDIGKNIVKLLLENYGFSVLDLGKDVKPDIIVETAIQENADIVAMSALMTTTVGSMRETIMKLKEKNFKGKIMVGGAVLTEEYAQSICADFYGKDALSAVDFAKKCIG